MNMQNLITYTYNRLEDYRIRLLSRDTLFTLIGLMLLLTLWHIASMLMHQVIIASPIEATHALFEMLNSEYFYTHFWVTLQRVFAGILSGGLVGFGLGIAAGLNNDIRNMLEPFRWLLMSVPPVVIVVLAMLWFGLGSTMVVFIAATLLSPIVYINSVKGMQMVDQRLTEMTDIYHFSLWMKLTQLYIPAMVAPLSAAMVFVVGSGVRIVVLAEVLGTTEGMGYALSSARSNLEIPQLFAWVLVSLAIVAIFEYALLRPIEHYLLRWKS